LIIRLVAQLAEHREPNYTVISTGCSLCSSINTICSTC